MSVSDMWKWAINLIKNKMDKREEIISKYLRIAKNHEEKAMLMSSKSMYNKHMQLRDDIIEQAKKVRDASDEYVDKLYLDEFHGWF